MDVLYMGCSKFLGMRNKIIIDTIINLLNTELNAICQ